MHSVLIQINDGINTRIVIDKYYDVQLHCLVWSLRLDSDLVEPLVEPLSICDHCKGKRRDGIE